MASDDEKDKHDSDIEEVDMSKETDVAEDISEDEKEKADDKSSPESKKDSDESDNEDLSVKPQKQPAGKFKRFFAGYWHKKLWTIPLTILVIAGIIFAIPSTRYKVLGMWVTNSLAVTVTDSTTNTPISGATVDIDGKHAVTNDKGRVMLTVSVGDHTIKIGKQYYKDSSNQVFVAISGQQTKQEKLVATGRQVPITVVNKISGKPIPDAELKVIDTSAKTDATGKAIIVLPTGSASLNATITASGFSALSTSVQVTDSEVAANTFKLTPSGRVYFLSDQSGNIDVVSTNLDGTGRKTVLAGTGNEDQNNTVLLASRDWKYLALLSKRGEGDGANAKLYLIDTSNGNQLTTMDEGNATFSPIGWSDHNFVYQVNRSAVKQWQSGQNALKTFNADTKKTTTIDQTFATGNDSNNISTGISFANIVKDRIIYGMSWSANNNYGPRLITGRKNTIYSVNADGSNKVDIKDITIPKNSTPYAGAYTTTWMYSVAKDPETLYIQSQMTTAYGDSSQQAYYIYKYDNNSAEQSNLITSDVYDKAQRNQITYLASPSNKQALWSQERDGKNNVYIGDYDGSNGKQIATGTDYTSYGWYTDNYILLEKNGSELFIMPPLTGAKALKISNYYKPPRSFYGYGGGYGGL